MNEAREITSSGLNKLFNAGRNLWLAGLGVAAEVEEGGRGLFGQLVERGRPVEQKIAKIGELPKQVTETVTGKANQAAREITKLVEETVEFEGRGVLRRLNLLTREDVELLSARLANLSQKIDDYVARRDALEAALPLERPVVLDAAGEPAVDLHTLDTLEPVAPKKARKPRAAAAGNAGKKAAKSVTAARETTAKTVKSAAATRRGKKG